MINMIHLYLTRNQRNMPLTRLSNKTTEIKQMRANIKNLLVFMTANGFKVTKGVSCPSGSQTAASSCSTFETI